MKFLRSASFLAAYLLFAVPGSAENTPNGPPTLSASPAPAKGYMGFEKPCPDQNPNMREPRRNETCDYVTIIKRCEGDLAERLFRQPREIGVDHPRRLACHSD
ncbi:hypothetical protein ACRQ5Q_27595 [Bradyrhizobium sp. PMVTL-01]|uniref:hypothetical protein n=1 Tax=Bradyrhizobium sp. PMVTL-01 TaxID=3434999 RepID=UPI003F7278E3